MRYAAFLRGINVGGHKQIKMEDLQKAFESLGFKSVKTYINSGNVIFDSESNFKDMIKKIENKINKRFGFNISVFLISINEIKQIIKSNPLKKIKKDEAMYVTFLPTNLKISTLPIKSSNNDVEVFSIKEGVAFSISRKVNGRYGFPNGFIEKKLKCPATTRNWNTINKIVNY